VLENKTILVTGGTGSFGHDFVKLALAQLEPRRVIVYSRDEKKQHDMRLLYRDDRLKFVIGDVRDAIAIDSAMRGVDYVFHAAALKQVPSCEFFPMEAVRTNVLGAENVLSAAERNGVERLVVLSTDKAVYPVNAMGQTKALMEKLVLARAKDDSTETTCSVVRYGNVMCSRGSVIPLFVQQIREGKPLTITHPRMTRLLLALSEAVELVRFALERAERGDLFVRKAPAATVQDLAQALLNLFEADNPIKIVGVREGEKMHEALVSREELARAEEFTEHYRIPSTSDRNYADYFTQGSLTSNMDEEGYTSYNARRLAVPEIEQLLLTLPDVQEALDDRAQRVAPRRRAA
jgi:UDP-glucose 4-epimerase